MHGQRQRELNLFSLKKEVGWRGGGGRRDLTAVFNDLKVGGYRENHVLLQGTREKGKRQYSQVTADMCTRKMQG